MNKIYKRNQIKDNDHIQTPPIVLNKIQEIVELKFGKGARFYDVSPLRGRRENLKMIVRTRLITFKPRINVRSLIKPKKTENMQHGSTFVIN